MTNKNRLIAAIFVMLPLLTADIKIIFSWMVGLAIGYTLQRSKFCFTAALRDYFLFGSTSLLKTLVYTLLFSLVGFFIVQQIILLQNGLLVGSIKPVGLHTALGSIFFGFGMTLGGGCLAIGLVRLGEGFYIYLLTYFFAFIGVLLSIVGYPLWQGLVMNAPKIYLPEYLGKISAFTFSVFILAVILILVVRKERSFGVLPEYIAATSDLPSGWKPINTALVLAVLNTSLLFIMKNPIRISNEFSVWAKDFLILIGKAPGELPFFKRFQDVYSPVISISWETYLILGIIIGSFAAAVYHKEFRPKLKVSKRQIVFSVIGGLFMGIGARLAFGCSAGALIAGIASMSLHGWVFALLLPLGVFMGVCVLEKTV